MRPASTDTGGRVDPGVRGCGSRKGGHPPEVRLKARRELSAPIVEAMRP